MNDVLEVINDFEELAKELYSCGRIDEWAFNDITNHIIITRSQYEEPKGDCYG